ncbi:MAG: hypothetical protein ABJ275_05510 [Maricaulaceae bacterium]
MIRLIKYMLVCLTASLLLHFNANAQTGWVKVNYAEKIETIRLAKAGDADALFKLGLSHFNNSHSAQGQVIAERFFYYASKKGHSQAKQYLIALQNINGVNSTIKPAHKEPVKSRGVKPESKIQTNKYINEQVVAAAIINTPKGKREKNKVGLNKYIDEQVGVRRYDRLNDQTDLTLAIEATIPPVETPYVKVAANIDQNKLIKSDVQANNLYHPKKELGKQPIYKTIWVNLIKLLFFMTILLAFIAVVLVFAKFSLRSISYIKGKKALPKDFDNKVYLILNPDVKLAGVKATTHYILHGEREGRRYKY